jgi:hypothetical protein
MKHGLVNCIRLTDLKGEFSIIMGLNIVEFYKKSIFFFFHKVLFENMDLRIWSKEERIQIDAVHWVI